MEIKIKYFTDIEPIQFIAGKSDWYDLRAAEDVEMKAGEFKLIKLGVAMQLPEGYEAIMAPRSSTFKNFGILQTNSIGVIDETFWFTPMYRMGNLLTFMELFDETKNENFRQQEEIPA